MTVAAFHHLLLRVAGWVPDELVSVARDSLVRGVTGDVAEMVGYAAATGRFPLVDRDVELLADALGAAPTVVRAGARPVLPPVVFSRRRPAAPNHNPDPDVDPDQPAADELDQVDRVCVEAVGLESEETANAVWRAWRSPDRPTTWPPPRRVYLVRVAADGDLLALVAARLQEVLEHAGEADPQVEVFAEADDLPPYQRAALAGAALIWTADGTGTDPVVAVRPRVARLLDPGVQPGIAPGREELAGPERDRVLAFLAGGVPILASTAAMDDVVGGGRALVPMTCRSDGVWVWSDGVAYYLRTHGVAPEDEFLRHIRAAGYRAEPPDMVATHRATRALAESGAEAPW
ncbi:hypothetical protein ACH495_10235 [Micromonospora sp. NPDC018662]|uniref:hypothetical protein n=1 Tax=Micromonospora sp. NPDC018662 TaxID=3364238 RepID=UPI0037B7085E